MVVAASIKNEVVTLVLLILYVFHIHGRLLDAKGPRDSLGIDTAVLVAEDELSDPSTACQISVHHISSQPFYNKWLTWCVLSADLSTRCFVLLLRIYYYPVITPLAFHFRCLGNNGIFQETHFKFDPMILQFKCPEHAEPLLCYLPADYEETRSSFYSSPTGRATHLQYLL